MGVNPGFGSPLPRGANIVGGGWRGSSVGGGRHAGLDIPAIQGTPVSALADGMVVASSASPLGDLGIYAAIAHSSGFVSRYLHFSQLAVESGQQVRKGQLIGYTGNTGLSSGPHLHLDLKVPDAGVLAAIAADVGTPAGGFEGNVTGFGSGVPAEPWVPVDRYEPSVIANAQAQGIPLYKPRFGLIVKVALAGAIGWGLYTLFAPRGADEP